MNKDYDEVLLKMTFELEGCKPEEREWAKHAFLRVYNTCARFANESGWRLYNTIWDALYPNSGYLNGPLAREYEAGAERFMRPIMNHVARKVGVSKDRKRIVRLKSALDSVELSSDLTTGTFYGTVEDYKRFRFF